MAVQWDLYEMYLALLQAPLYHLIIEGLLMVWVAWLLLRKPKIRKPILTEKEQEELITDWQPEPLVPDTNEDHPALDPFVVEGKVGKYVCVNGRDCLNLATHNYLGLVEDKNMEDSAVECIKKYGVGSCGPRGFYGTVDVHLNLETRLAEFMELEEALIYSYGFSTIASAIPAYAKRGDVIFADEGSNFAVQKGLEASRSDVRFFKHNDMKDLERLLEAQSAKELKNGKNGKPVRKFLVVEGVYMNSGDICPLPEIVELKSKYKVRLFVDESISFGTLGRHGKGITEYYGIPADHIDLIMGSLEYAIPSVGGFCVGTSYVVDHQRLSGLGYCFSASLPPMLAAAAISAIDTMEHDPDMFLDLNNVCRKLHSALSTLHQLRLGGHRDAPVKHLRLAKSTGCHNHDGQLLRQIANESMKRGLAVIVASYLDQSERFLPQPSLRLVANRLLTENDLDKAIKILEDSCTAVLS
ncbi:serine palmitoyltransferase 1 [Daphnia magna]|nr:serine palmitoyltransferase 1 [Daphnia magna]KZS20238.1 Serine palmitoyltransferase 1 [Daphnia magna]